VGGRAATARVVAVRFAPRAIDEGRRSGWVGRQRGPALCGPFPTAPLRTGRARLRASGSPASFIRDCQCGLVDCQAIFDLDSSKRMRLF
jgi:hypothetical protein